MTFWWYVSSPAFVLPCPLLNMVIQIWSFKCGLTATTMSKEVQSELSVQPFFWFLQYLSCPHSITCVFVCVLVWVFIWVQVTKIFQKKKNSVTYSFRQSFSLYGMQVLMFENQCK